MKNAAFVNWTLLLLIAGNSIVAFGMPNIGVNIHIFFATSYLALIMILFRAFGPKYRRMGEGVKTIVMLFLAYSLITVARGFFIAESYWDWKLLAVAAMRIFVPVALLTGVDKALTQSFFRMFVTVLLPLAFLLALPLNFIIANDEFFSRTVMPCYYLVLFIPFFFKRKHRVAVFAIAVFSAALCMGLRSHLARTAVVAGLAAFFMLFRRPYRAVLETGRNILFFAPLLLFTLAATNVFNVFHMDDYIEWSANTGNKAIDKELTSDTRTFLYMELISSVVKHDKAIFGESAAGKYESQYFKYADTNAFREGNDRGGAEVGILNVFMYGGIVGVIIYGVMFYMASFLAVCRSRNTAAKALGLFIAFRWAWSFVEEIQAFDLNYFFLWLTIGLCLSKEFRDMTDVEVKVWINNMFYRKERYYVEDRGAADGAQ
ncbi:MAG: hypothetical protein LBH06_05325 [Rikenellaceae bacterium]|nr:hypothetical protein [Rikenellaceae bacterium]